MNREIKFRCRTDLNSWVYFTLQDLASLYGFSAITGEPIDDLVDNKGNKTDRFNLEEAQQYTGLKDKNGKDVFEGDIIKNKFGIFEVKFGDIDIVIQQGHSDKNITKYKGKGFIVNKLQELHFYDDGFDSNICIFTDCEVIGNIYENKELLENEEY